MYREICFYQYYGNGDYHNSKEFVRELVQAFPETGFFYAHLHSPYLTEDLDRIRYAQPQEWIMEPSKAYVKGQASDLYFNTWLGLDSRNILPGIGLSLENYRKYYEYILRSAGISYKFSDNLTKYIPRINFSRLYQKSIVDAFVDGRKNIVLVATGDVFSGQARNFPMLPLVERLAVQFPDKDFVVTTPIQNKYPNLYSTVDIFDRAFDLNAIGYLSTYCETIIGRASSPYVFTQIYNNLFNPDKKFLAITNHRNSSQITIGLTVPAMQFWQSDSEDPYKEMETVVSI